MAQTPKQKVLAAYPKAACRETVLPGPQVTYTVGTNFDPNRGWVRPIIWLAKESSAKEAWAAAAQLLEQARK